jgi:hypothetical protein
VLALTFLPDRGAGDPATIARAIAGSVKWRMLLARSVPLPRAGNQPSLTANSRISTMAATNR